MRGNVLIALIKLRLFQIEAVRKHDVSFVKENLAQQQLGRAPGVDAVEVLCDNRQLLMMTFMCDVLILCRFVLVLILILSLCLLTQLFFFFFSCFAVAGRHRHMGNFPKMLSKEG